MVSGWVETGTRHRVRHFRQWPHLVGAVQGLPFLPSPPSLPRHVGAHYRGLDRLSGDRASPRLGCTELFAHEATLLQQPICRSFQWFFLLLSAPPAPLYPASLPGSAWRPGPPSTQQPPLAIPQLVSFSCAGCLSFPGTRRSRLCLMGWHLLFRLDCLPPAIPGSLCKC